MSDHGEFYCVVKIENHEDNGHKGDSSAWTTFRWTDEYGNSIAPFFSSQQAGQVFLTELSGWQLKRYPVAFVISVILTDIKQDTSFYTIDPISTLKFKALSPVQFLVVLMHRGHPLEIEDPTLLLEHEDIVPIEALFGEGCDPTTESEYRQLLASADVIFGIDVKKSRQTIVFGRLTLEQLVRTGQSDMLGIMNIGIGQGDMGIEKLATLVQDIKGHHDYCEAHTP